MNVQVRFVQRFQPGRKKEFLDLEALFYELEQSISEYPKGRRSLPYAGREPGNTLIWECEFPSLEEAQRVLAFLDQDSRHRELYVQQAPYMLEHFTEIYELIPFPSKDRQGGSM